MRPQKPERPFRFRVLSHDPATGRGVEVGQDVSHASTCFLARADVAVRWGCDVDLVRPEPRRVMT